MELKPIRTENDYQEALQRLEEIFDAKPNTPERDELEVLAILIDDYEKKNYPIDFPDPVEAIKFRMEQMGYDKNDLAELMGFRSRMNDILSKNKKLTIQMIRQFNKKLGIPSDILLQEY